MNFRGLATHRYFMCGRRSLGHPALFLCAGGTFSDTRHYFYVRVALFRTLGIIFMCGWHFFGHSTLFLCAGGTFSDTRHYFYVRVALFRTLTHTRTRTKSKVFQIIHYSQGVHAGMSLVQAWLIVDKQLCMYHMHPLVA
ncbi:hypothetical protein CA207_20330 [Macrococcoides caseolyticum]|nr:hypothetical protein CA207_20330 [Macrococcus caseolyticus]STY74979.1 Uncharacterised protein [Macrococcus caseolyticus]